MVSAASSGISTLNSSSNAITSSTVSRLSAPRSSMKFAFSVTLSASTPRCSTTIFFTRSAMSLIVRFLVSLVDGWPPGAVGKEKARSDRTRPKTATQTVAKAAFRAPVHPLPTEPEPVSTALFVWRERGRGGPRPSEHRHPAVHVDGLAGDVGGLRGGEVGDGGRDLGAL